MEQPSQLTASSRSAICRSRVRVHHRRVDEREELIERGVLRHCQGGLVEGSNVPAANWPSADGHTGEGPFACDVLVDGGPRSRRDAPGDLTSSSREGACFTAWTRNSSVVSGAVEIAPMNGALGAGTSGLETRSATNQQPAERLAGGRRS
jgi:hypothetical protein